MTARGNVNLHIRSRRSRRDSQAEEVGTSEVPALFCRLPFTEVSVSIDGAVYPNCCPDWVTAPFGNVLHQSWDDIWNGPQAVAMRQSALEGDLRFCDSHWCPHIQAAAKGQADPHVVPVADIGRLELPEEVLTGAVQMSVGPTSVGMHYDSSCNLACPTCRDGIVTAQGEAADTVHAIHRVVDEQVVVSAKRLTVTGAGDPFASKFLREFLTSFSREKYPEIEGITLLTNAIMFTPAMWERMPGLHDVGLDVDVSIDAATAATYEIVRWPGRWERLQENLHFIAGLPNLEVLGVNMTVSRLNFGEVHAFYEFALELAATLARPPLRLEFKRARNWGNHSTAAWERVALERLAPEEFAWLRSQLIEVDRAERAGRQMGLLTVYSNMADFMEEAPELPDQSVTGLPGNPARRGAHLRADSEPRLAAGLWDDLKRSNGGDDPFVLRCDSEDRLVAIDERLEVLLGLDRASLVGGGIADLATWGRRHLGEDLQSRFNAEQSTWETVFLRADGSLGGEMRSAVVDAESGDGTTIYLSVQKAEK